MNGAKQGTPKKTIFKKEKKSFSVKPSFETVFVRGPQSVERRDDHREVRHRVPELGEVVRNLKNIQLK